MTGHPEDCLRELPVKDPKDVGRNRKGRINREGAFPSVGVYGSMVSLLGLKGMNL